MLTFKSLKSRIFGYFQSYSIFHSKFFKFTNYAITNIGDTYNKYINLHFPSRQSMDALNISSLFWMEKLIKLVSKRILYGGPKAVLCMKNRQDGYLGLKYIWMYISLIWIPSGAYLSIASFLFLSCSSYFALLDFL